MAVMAVADTATFDLERQRGRRVLSVRCASRPGTSTRSRPARTRSRTGWTAPSPTSCSCRRPSSPTTTRRSWPSRWPATSSSTTARAAGTASRSRPATGSAISDVVTNFGDGPVRDLRAGRRRRPARARTTSTRSTRRGCSRRRSTACGSSASTPRTAGSSDSPFYAGKLAWFERLGAGLRETVAAGRRPGHRRRLQRRPDRRRRLGSRRGPRRHPRVGAGTRRVPGAARPGPGRWLPAPPRRAGPLHLVGLPGGHVPQELRDADRPAARRRGRRGRGWSTPRSTARRARARRSRPTMRRSRRPRCSRAPHPPGLGRRAGAHRQTAAIRARRKTRGPLRTPGRPRRVALPTVGSRLDDLIADRFRRRDPPHRPGETLRWGPGGRRRLARGRQRRVLLAPRAVGLRQDDDPAHDRRLRAADRRTHPAARPRRHDGPARQAPGQYGLPALRAVPAPRCRRQRRRSGSSARTSTKAEITRRVGEALEPGPPRRLRAAQAEPALGRPAAARRPGPGAGQPAERAAPRRAAGRPRPQAPPPAPARAQAHPERGRDHVRVRDP